MENATDKEKAQLAKNWQIHIDKKPRFIQEREEAQEQIIACKKIDYDTMFNKGPKMINPNDKGNDAESDRPLARALKDVKKVTKKT